MSISRALSATMPATNLIASSPVACPSRSLISLSVSMSSWITPYLRPSRWNMANCWASTASRYRRLKRPVSGSETAESESSWMRPASSLPATLSSSPKISTPYRRPSTSKTAVFT